MMTFVPSSFVLVVLFVAPNPLVLFRGPPPESSPDIRRANVTARQRRNAVL